MREHIRPSAFFSEIPSPSARDKTGCRVARKFWTLDEARAVLPRVIAVTVAACEEAAEIVGELESSILPENLQEAREDELGAVVTRWTEAVIRLGADVKGLWLVDFDHGSGYYCWKLGESDILYEHSYEAGFAGRRLIGAERPEADGGPDSAEDSIIENTEENTDEDTQE